MAQLTVSAAGVTSILSLPNWINQSTNIDPRTGTAWTPYGVPFVGPYDTRPGPAQAADPQPGSNDTNAFTPQANKVTFTNPA
jgi:hypothetical protein